jgi:predicted glycosyltransferase
LKTRPLTFLVSPLDWGLGHASRMIPVISRLVRDGHVVILAGSGRSAELLRHTFPQLKFVFLRGHSIRMGSGKHSYMQLIFQLPALVFSVLREHRQLRKIVHAENIDIVISDNRYGLHCPEVFSVFITHQISPVLPAIFRWFEYPVYLVIRKLIQRFDQCLIPDFPDREVNLSGKLSHRFTLPSNTRYIGILSRFSLPAIPDEIQSSWHYDLAVVLSGPEPQVSIFEKLICRQLSGLTKQAILIRGMRNKPVKTHSNRVGDEGGLLHQVSHLEIASFVRVLQQAGLVISRSGYSGIMDFIALDIDAILVPTPGQSEQEYLAGWLSQKGWFKCVRQEELDLVTMLEPVHGNSESEKRPFSAKPDFQFIEELYSKYYQDSN